MPEPEQAPEPFTAPNIPPNIPPSLQPSLPPNHLNALPPVVTLKGRSIYGDCDGVAAAAAAHLCHLNAVVVTTLGPEES